MQERFSPIFVVGHPRSGTTLLAAILGRHSRLAATPETQFLTYSRYALERELPKGAVAVMDAYARTRLATLGLDRSDLLRRMSGSGKLTLDLVFRRVLEAYAEKHGKQIVVEKTPTHVRYIELLHAWYPDARFVWIVRDGRACVASLRKLDWASDNLYGLSWQWLRNISYGLRAESCCGDAIKRVKYEDLVTHPEAVTRAIDEWIGVEFEATQLDPTVQTDVVTASERSWKNKILEPISRIHAEAWREDLLPHEISLLSNLMSRGLQNLGYLPPSHGEKTQLQQRALACAMLLSCNAPFLSVQSALESTVKRIKATVRP